MRDKYGFALAAALLLVGGGCVGATDKRPAPAAEQAADGPSDRMTAPAATGDLDADIDVLIGGASDEVTAEIQSGAEVSTDDGGADIDTFLNSSYDVE